jgi:hypothetical protein
MPHTIFVLLSVFVVERGREMSGRIIHFRDFRRFNPPPNGLSERRVDSALQPSTRALASGLSRKRILRIQVTRISRLLDELESLCLTRECHEVGVVGPSRAGIEKARALPLQWPEPERNTQGSSGNEPQPDVDGDMLERMYQALSADA